MSFLLLAPVGLAAAWLLCVRLWSGRVRREVDRRTAGLLRELDERREAETNLRLVLDNFDAAVYRVAPDQTILLAEGRALDKIGMSAAELVGRRVSEVFAADPELLSRLSRCMAGEALQHQTRFRGVHLLFSSTPQFSASGRLESVIGVAMDVSELVATRERLEAGERRLDQALRATRAGVWEWDIPAGRFRRTPSWYVMLGYAPNPNALTMEQFLVLVHPEDRADIKRNLLDKAASGEPWEFEFRALAASGRYRWCRNRGEVVERDASGAPLRALGTSMDITANKRDQERYRVLFEAGHDGFLLLRNGRYVECNARTATLLGHTPEALLGSRPGDLDPVLQPDGRRSFAAIQEHLRLVREKGTHTFEWLCQRGDGTQFRAEITLALLEALGDTDILVVVRDITERAMVQELMAQSEKMLSLGGLAAGMAHEINNPLGVILQATENIRRRLAPDVPANTAAAAEHGVDLEALDAFFRSRNIAFYLDAIGESGRRVARIVASMLGFSRGRAGTASPCRLDELLEHALSLASFDIDLARDYGFRRIDIRREFEANLPPVPCVPGDIEQVLLNLLKNAAQAMHGIEAPRILLRTFAEGAWACAEVRDCGPGVPAHVLARIFEPFFTTKAVGVGTGLGLSVSAIIARNHGGELFVHKVRGWGACFVLRLPLHRETGDILSPGAAAPQTAAG
ncbi:MAG: PAS domain S-box protein [Desulfovibrionaceae bacterium]|nr:PAS domain S-box protein [Desulfovibrionaceae bacterium]